MRNRFPGLIPLGDATAFVDRILEIIEHIRLFEDFERGEVEALAARMQCYRAPAGAPIIREGDSGDFMLILLDGQCEIVRNDPTGVPQRIGLAGPGKTLGEMSMIDGEPRFASCIALEDTCFAVLDRDGLTRIIADDPRLGIKILMELVLLLSQRLRGASAKLVDGLKPERNAP
jgi:CRP-like cAMP-binding protein